MTSANNDSFEAAATAAQAAPSAELSVSDAEVGQTFIHTLLNVCSQSM